MEISEIKQRLSMATVLQYYGLKPDKQNRLCCQFHEDKTPSMQLYYKTQTAYCFSSNCPIACPAMAGTKTLMLLILSCTKRTRTNTTPY